jgi:NADH-quinone oxidoreductase subunit N
MNPPIDFHAVLPELIWRARSSWCCSWTCSCPRAQVVGDADRSSGWRHAVATLALIGTTRVTFGGRSSWTTSRSVPDPVRVVALVSCYLRRYLRDGRYYQGEFYFLLLCSFLGCLTMAASRDLLLLFISLEMVSAPGFLLTGLKKGDPRSNEAALKFFLISVLSTAVMLYGMSLIYGITGTTRLTEIATKLAGPAGDSSLALAAILFVVVGFAFKVSAFPFQFWAPDTYEGAPVPVAAFLSVASKAAGFVGLLQLMFHAFRQRRTSGRRSSASCACSRCSWATWSPSSNGRSCGCSRTRRSPRPGTCCCRSRSPATPRAWIKRPSLRWSCTSWSTR